LKKRMKLQWRRYKIGTLGVVIVCFIAILLLYLGILSFLEGASVGILFIVISLLLFGGVALDIYRMYGY
jgi:hypothetical protein